MSWQQTVYVRGQCLGTSAREHSLVHGQLQAPTSLAYFCSTCGEVWARVVIPGEKFHVWTLSCDRHDPGWQFSVAGGLWLLWDRDFNEALPALALKRELELTMAHTERWL